MKEHKRRALTGLTVRDRVALDLPDIKLRANHLMDSCCRSARTLG